MSDPNVVRAAGGIVVRGDGVDRRFALVHRPRYDDWSFPKGKLDDGELEEGAALREVLEETGLRCHLDAHVGAVTYTDRTGRPKIVRYWTMTPDGGSFAPNDEVDELRWLGADEALEMLSYAHDRDLLRGVVSSEATAPLYVIRHAKAGQRQRWEGPDERRPLTRRGVRQAKRLVERFRGLELARILSSPLDRCVQTMEPLARARGLEIERAPELAEGADLAEAVDFVRGLDGRPTAICGHGGEIQALVGEFAREGADLEGVGGLGKGSVWVLDRRDAVVVSARYLAAPRA
jgi:8-oxo-dGTP pyrophosphatase MutT (NUDIX family)/phosphohistidine phosphatase SixA